MSMIFGKVKKIAKWTGIISIIILIIVIFIFGYFEIKRIEYPISKIEKISFLGKRIIIIEKPKEIFSTSQTSSPDFIINKQSTVIPYPQSKEQVFPSKEISSNKTTIHLPLPILMYHHINYLPLNATKLQRDLTVSPETFEKQMEYLFKQNYQPITFEEFFNFLKTKREIPERSLIITFDDGWKNQYQYAFPVLKKYGFKATFFVVVNSIGNPASMNWEELKELLENEMEIGSHSMTHSDLRHLSSASLKYEIQNSKIILEKNLGRKINVFAYPYGAFDTKTIEAVKESNYLMARTTLEGINQNLENLYTLKGIQVYDSLEQFKRLFPSKE